MIDLNHILLSVKVGIYSEDGKTRAKFNEHPVVFSNNTLQTLFCHAELCLNGKLISDSNNCYLHSAFINTELTTDTERKETWVKCQGYNYLEQTKEQDQAFNKLYADFDRKKVHGRALRCITYRLFGMRKSFDTRSHSSFAPFPIS